MPTLKQAQNNAKVEAQFVAEHESDQTESADFDKVFSSMTKQETPTTTQRALSKGDCADYM